MADLLDGFVRIAQVFSGFFNQEIIDQSLQADAVLLVDQAGQIFTVVSEMLCYFSDRQ